MSVIVVKVGGSLYDCADLGTRLQALIRNLTHPVLIVPGGGATADAIRAFDVIHGLGEEAAHWLALQACSVNGHALSRVLGDLRIVGDVVNLSGSAIVDLYSFAQADERRPDHWPHRWDVTSDSMAVRVAHVAGAGELVLLKSIDIEAGNWSAASARGEVDAYFPIALGCTPNLHVRSVNFRNRHVQRVDSRPSSLPGTPGREGRGEGGAEPLAGS